MDKTSILVTMVMETLGGGGRLVVFEIKWYVCTEKDTWGY